MWVSVEIVFKVRCNSMQQGGCVWLTHIILCRSEGDGALYALTVVPP